MMVFLKHKYPLARFWFENSMCPKSYTDGLFSINQNMYVGNMIMVQTKQKENGECQRDQKF